MNEAKLLACPFCGGNDLKLDEKGTDMNLSLKRVECKTCGAQTGTVHDHDYQAIKAWNVRAGGQQPAVSKTPEPSTLASATCYASWVIVLNAKRAPIVKRCDSHESEIKMMQAMRKMNPNATVIHAQLNPGDHKELWATSEAHWLALAEA